MKRVLAAIVLAALALHCEDIVTINSKYTKTYTTEVTRAVGPTTQVGARGTLPQPTPTNLNAVFLAPNGSDAGVDGAAGTGVLAAPVLTVAKALAVMTAQPARATTVIVRNAYVGDLTFTISGNQAFAAFNLQVTPGEIATIASDSSTIRQISFTTGGVNGLNFKAIDIRNTGTGIPANCYNDVMFGGTWIAAPAAAATITYDYCIGLFAINPSGLGTAIVTNNCILVPLRTTGTYVMAMNYTSTGTGTITWTANRCLVLGLLTPTGNSYLLQIADGVGAGTRTYNANFNNCYLFSQRPYFIRLFISSSHVVNISYSYSLDAAGSNILYEAGAPAIIPTFTATNPITPTTPPMFVDFQLFNGDNPDFEYSRLQALGKAVPGGTGRYSIDSPLIGAGLAGVDVNPWDESTTLESQGYAQSYDFRYPPKSFLMTPEPVNPNTIFDTLGNKHNYNDGLRRKLTFTWGDAQALEPDDIRRFNDMMGDRGTVQIYPKPTGVNGNLWTDDDSLEDGALVSSGATATFTPTSPSPQMIDRNWAGWWLEIVDGSVSYIYYIASNTSTVLNLVDKVGDGFPSDDTYDFAIRFILATLEQNPIPFVQQDYTEFLKGGRWRETETTLGSNSYGYTTEAIEFFEAEDDEEVV